MKAITYTKYGPPEVLQLQEVEKPTPKDNEVLIKIHTTAVNKGDCELRSPKIPNSIWVIVRLFFGPFKPRKKILGAYFAGTIVKTGKTVTKFNEGDTVFACSGAGFGAYAEYTCLPEEEAMAIKPNNMSFVEAAAVPLGLDSLHFLRKANIQPGQKVLVNGAGGGIGTVAVQLAKYYGAEVTAVDKATKLDMLKSIGADQVIDFTKEDFARNKATYDVIFDLVGKGAYSRCLKALKPGGKYLLTNPDGISQLLRGVWTTLVTSKKVISQFASANAKDLNILKELIEAGHLRSLVDKTYPMEKVVEAHRYVETENKIGNVVLTIVPNKQEV